jgi:hypothetical protein
VPLARCGEGVWLLCQAAVETVLKGYTDWPRVDAVIGAVTSAATALKEAAVS